MRKWGDGIQASSVMTPPSSIHAFDDIAQLVFIRPAKGPRARGIARGKILWLGLEVTHISHAPLISLARTQSRGYTEPKSEQGNVAC